MYTALQPIRPYVAPDWQVKPQGDPITNEEDVYEELMVASPLSDPTLIESVTGYDYDHIIRCTDEYGENRYYLAR